MPEVEQLLSQRLRAILTGIADGEALVDSENYREAMNTLERYIPEVLREIHPEWKYESLDGVLPIVSRKLGPDAIEILGECILISDQCMVPLKLCIQLAPAGDEISYFECKLGERGPEGMKRLRYSEKKHVAYKLVIESGGDPQTRWAYQVSFGQKR